jgi:general stress protein CsbA
MIHMQWIGVLTVLVILAASYGAAYGLRQYGIALDDGSVWTGYAIFMAALLVRAVLDLARRRFSPAAP